MIELFARTETTYLERADGNLTFGNSTPVKEKGTIELVIGTDRFLIPIDENGFWRWESPTAYADGSYSLSLRQIDMAGNISSPTLATIVVDSTPPEAPELLFMFDDQGAEKGAFLPGETTDDKRPTLTGIAQKGAIVYLRDADGKDLGSAVADAKTGKWVMETEQDLPDGSNSLTLVAVETFAKQQREGVASEPFTFIIAGDATPTGVTITDAFDNVGSATGALSSGALTDDTTPTLRGTATGSDSVLVYFRLAGSDMWTGSATVAVTDGSWSWTPGSAFASGNYEFQASNGDIASALFTLEIATAEQIAQRTRIESAYDDFGQEQGPLANGAITDDATPTLRGRAEANAHVVIRFMLEGGTAASVVVDADSAGNWRWTPSAELANGVWSFDVQPQGAARWSNAFKLEITGSGSNSYDPTIAYAYDDFGSSTGELKSGAFTDDATPTLHGKAAANSVVYLQAIQGEEVQVYSVVADSSSKWEWTPPTELELGDWKFQVSKGAGTEFGDAFELKIGAAGNYSNIIDFESAFGDNQLNNMVIGSKYVNNDNISFALYHWHGSYNGQKLPFLTPGVRAPSMGEKALEIINKDYVSIGKSVTEKSPSLVFAYDFRFELFNPTDENVEISLSIVYRSETGGETITKNLERIKLTPGLTVFSRENLPESLQLSDLYAVTQIGIYNFPAFVFTPTGNPPIWFDNFSWEPPYWEKSKIASIQENEDIYHLDAIDQLSETTIIGNDIKIDTLQLTGKDQYLDLTTPTAKIESIEIFDITGAGDNTLKLDLNALLQHGEKDLFIEDGKTQLVVKGNEGDVVKLVDILPEGSDISEWQHQEGTVTVAGVEYNVYTHGDDAELLVQQGVKTELV